MTMMGTVSVECCEVNSEISLSHFVGLLILNKSFCVHVIVGLKQNRIKERVSE